MGDNINVDWGLAQDQAAATGAMADAGVKGAQQGLDLGRQQAELAALRGTDLTDPNSTSNALSGLVRAGAIDQAKAVSDLSFVRQMRAAVPSALSGLGLGGQPAQTPPAAAASSAPAATPADTSDLVPNAAALAGGGGAVSSTPLQSPNAAEVSADAGGAGASPAGQAVGQINAAHARETLTMAAQATAQLQKLPLEERPAAFQQVAGQMQARGVPPEAIQAAGDDLSDAGLAQKQALYQSHLDGNPAMGGTAPAAGQPGPQPGSYAWAQKFVQDPGNYQRLAVMKAAGFDLTPMAEEAKSLTSPEVEQEALDQHEPARAAATEAGKLGVDNANTTETFNLHGVPTVLTRAQALLISKADPGAIAGLSPGAESQQREAGTLAAEAAGGEAATEATTRGAALGGFVNTNMGGRPTMMLGRNLEQLQSRGTPGAGVGLTPGEAEGQVGDVKDLQGQVEQAAQRRGDLQKAQSNGQQIIGLADTVGTGHYTPALADLAAKLPFGHSAKDYATNASLLSQNLAQSFKSSIDGINVPKLHSEADAVMGAIPKVGSQQDQLRLYGASITAGANYKMRYDDFVTNYAAQNPGGGLRAAQAAWANGPGRASYLADPVYRNLKMSDGKPAVVVDPKTGAGVYMPGTKQQFVFRAQ